MSKATVFKTGGDRIALRRPIEADRDWATLRLQSPICSRGGLAPVHQNKKTPNESRHGQSVIIAGMRSNDGAAPEIILRACRTHSFADLPGSAALKTEADKLRGDFANPQALVLHDCKGGPYASGAPLLVHTAGGVRVLAMHVGTYVRARVVTRDDAIVEQRNTTPVVQIAVRATEFALAPRVLRRKKQILRPALRRATSRSTSTD